MEYERSLGEVVAIEAVRDPERLTEPSGACSQGTSPTSPFVHYGVSLDRLQTTYQNGLPFILGPCDDVHAPVNSVTPVDVRATARTEHRPVARRHPASCGGVRGRIVRAAVRFRLDDDARTQASADRRDQARAK